MQRLFRRLNTVESINRRLRLSFRVIVLILVVPAIVSIASLLSNNIRYNAIIAHMGRVGISNPAWPWIFPTRPGALWPATRNFRMRACLK